MAEAKPTFEPRKACGTCGHGELVKDIRYVVCRRSPPTPVTVPVRQGNQMGFQQLGFVFPTMPKAEWCNEYKQRGTHAITSYPQDNNGSEQS